MHYRLLHFLNIGAIAMLHGRLVTYNVYKAPGTAKALNTPSTGSTPGRSSTLQGHQTGSYTRYPWPEFGHKPGLSGRSKAFRVGYMGSTPVGYRPESSSSVPRGSPCSGSTYKCSQGSYRFSRAVTANTSPALVGMSTTFRLASR